MQNHEIAKVLDEIADLLEISGENFFRVRAYRNAARAIGDHPVQMSELDVEELRKIAGIGADLADKIQTCVATGEIPLHRELTTKVPAGLLDLTRIPGLGPKRIKALWQELGVKNRDDLRRAAAAGALKSLPGMGAKLQERILESLDQLEKEHPGRILLHDATRIADALVAHMKKRSEVKQLDVAGSFRRRRETVGDLDLLVVSTHPEAVMTHFLEYPRVAEKLGAGPTKSSVVLTDGLQVDLRVVEPECYGAAILYFTGSKAHGVHLRKIAQSLKLLLNEYGLMRGEEPVAGKTEADVYRALGLAWIAPELREDRGEIEAAAKGRLPRLITRDDLRGDLHTHSTWTDGRASIEDMAKSAQQHRLEYFAVTDHSQRLKMARGLDPKRLREQWKEIEQVDAKIRGITLLRGIEVDILEDGALDLPDDVLGELDWVVASVHSRIDQDQKTMTRRLLKAIRNRSVNVIGHPSNRLIGRRPPSNFDLGEVLRVAREEGCALEVNSQPDRLDLVDSSCIAAREAGVKLVISSDSHHPRDFDGLDYGIDQARRGWIEREQVLNTLPLEEFRRSLR
ncbi:MAG: DNA polymerase/3'-5' exonuclease PolX [Candidatus Binataceae bacterium]